MGLLDLDSLTVEPSGVLVGVECLRGGVRTHPAGIEVSGMCVSVVQRDCSLPGENLQKIIPQSWRGF